MYNFLLFIIKITNFFFEDKQYYVINNSFNNKFIENILII